MPDVMSNVIILLFDDNLKMDAWRVEKKNSFLDHFLTIDKAGSLSAAELLEIVRVVRPDESAVV